MIKVMAHRGASIAYPENTLPAFEEAVRLKADGIELDVHFSKDKELIVMHDEKIDRTTDGSGNICSYTLKELKQFDAGVNFTAKTIHTPIPTLKEVFDLLIEKNYAGILNIELKTDYFTYEGIEKKLAEFVDSQNLPFDVIYSSFSLKSLWEMYRVSPQSKLNYLFDQEKEKAEIVEKSAFLEGLHPNFPFLGENEEQLGNFTKKIRVWTINQEERMRYCLKQPIDTIITDNPARVLALRSEME